MKLSVRALTFASGIIWGGSILACGLINLAYPRYAKGFLQVMSSVYPGFRNSRNVEDVLVGAAYGIVDGAAAGAVAATLYNSVADRVGPRPA